jgi:Rrf2 family protein
MASVNTQFSIGVHLLAGLASRDGLVTSEALAESVNTNPAFVKRVLAKMSRASLIITHTGKSGGCELARRPEKISLLDVYLAVEAPRTFSVHNYPSNKGCVISRNIKDVMGEISDDAQRAFEAQISKTSIADVVRKIEAS